jgi:hypothetical protein
MSRRFNPTIFDPPKGPRMKSLTRQIFQAILGNGYEVQVDRQRGDGVSVLLHNPTQNEEAFYFFTDQNESQVVETMAWQYCSDTQLEHLFPDSSQLKGSRYHADLQMA